jgi:purine-nucleoside phosphorylase
VSVDGAKKIIRRRGSTARLQQYLLQSITEMSFDIIYCLSLMTRVQTSLIILTISQYIIEEEETVDVERKTSADNTHSDH